MICKIYIKVITFQIIYKLSIWYFLFCKTKYKKYQLVILEVLHYIAQKASTRVFSTNTQSDHNIKTKIRLNKIRFNRLLCKSMLRIITSYMYKDIIFCFSQKHINMKRNIKISISYSESKTQIKPKIVKLSFVYLVLPLLVFSKLLFLRQKTNN